MIKKINEDCIPTIIEIFNEDCITTMDKMIKDNVKCDLVLTSPPYNTCRLSKTQKSFDNYNNRYDIHLDNMTDEEYCNWTVDIFNHYDKILNKNGCVLYNMSYGNENPNTMWLAISDILRKTNFMIADTIIWKKRSALPNNVSHNKLTRIIEYVFVLCRKDEYKTFNCNKKVKSYNSKGQKYYENIFNFVEAKNNDGTNPYNKATYSTELCEKLLNIYAKEGNTIYDSFMGTGTTAVACVKLNMNCYGSELSKNQCDFAIERIKNEIKKENSNE